MNHLTEGSGGFPGAQEVRAADPLLFSLLETASALKERLEDALAAVGLSPAKMEALDQLVRAGKPLPLRALADGQRCVPSNMTTLIDRLESEGLVRRVDDPSDRRSVRAALTPLGEERAAAGARVVAQAQDAFAERLSPVERAALAQILTALRRG
jgi:DNA-binding MarR family transcriptional regulator